MVAAFGFQKDVVYPIKRKINGSAASGAQTP